MHWMEVRRLCGAFVLTVTAFWFMSARHGQIRGQMTVSPWSNDRQALVKTKSGIRVAYIQTIRSLHRVTVGVRYAQRIRQAGVRRVKMTSSGLWRLGAGVQSIRRA